MWPKGELNVERFIAHLEKSDGLWLISRIKFP